MDNTTLLHNLSPDDLKTLIRQGIKEELSDLRLKAPVKYTTRKEACKKFNISLPTVDARIADGTFKSVRIGGRVLIVDNNE